MKHPITIFGRKNCPSCDNAQLLCLVRGYNVSYQDVEDPVAHAEMTRRNPNAQTVPQIFIGDHHIGGYEDLLNTPELQILKMMSE